MVNLNISSWINKLGNEKIGQIAGFLLAEQKAGQLRGTGLFGNISDQLQAGMTDLHMPNIEHILEAFTAGGWRSDMLKSLFMVYLGGYVAGELKIHPGLTRIGKVAQKLSVNAMLGVGAEALVEYSTISHSPGPSSGGNPGGQGRGYSY